MALGDKGGFVQVAGARVVDDVWRVAGNEARLQLFSQALDASVGGEGGLRVDERPHLVIAAAVESTKEQLDGAEIVAVDGATVAPLLLLLGREADDDRVDGHLPAFFEISSLTASRGRVPAHRTLASGNF